MEPTNEQVTTTPEQVSTQPVEKPIEEKTDTQVVDTQNKEGNDSPLEGSELKETKPEGIVTPTEGKNPVEGKQEVSEEIQKKLDRLAEYELKDKELTDLKGRLGVTDTIPDNQVFSAQQQLAIVENQAQQEYIRLCNEYGVDYRPDKIDASGKELLEKDPKAFYELKFKLTNLNEQVDAKRMQVQNFIQQKEYAAAFERNRQVLDASPAISRVVNNYIKSGQIGAEHVDDIIRSSLDIATEAYEMGRQAALAEKSQVNPAKVLNNNTISQQAQSTPIVEDKPLTLADIENMDIATYAKNEALINQMFRENKLR